LKDIVSLLFTSVLPLLYLVDEFIVAAAAAAAAAIVIIIIIMVTC